MITLRNKCSLNLGRNVVPCMWNTGPCAGPDRRYTGKGPYSPRYPEFTSKVLQFVYGKTGVRSDASGRNLTREVTRIQERLLDL